MYLLDTPVITELRKARSGKADPGVVNWAGGVARQNMYVSTLTLLELEGGVAQVERKDASYGQALRSWLDDQVMKAFEGRILAIDAAVVKKRAALPYVDNKGDRDALIAATALVHGLTVVTRHISNFRSGRVKVFNPWGYTPENEDEADWQENTGTGPVWLKNLFLRF
ncbi:twitching motility protein PilT [Asticcacaulis sp. AC460]|uniref:type II toxin-antitoxin system VapC family toxin n=1 Tax=Asticcacaulis sp. AC460 TaxID=1282360 RepID=UPI0003C3FE12|nr:type II toxin-antitoxin system VapC family toxin [Asticcacaulis sp. AC460]ESQ89131.1 twitching motility protein PilT [Asticcacaulis sp. AC460]